MPSEFEQNPETYLLNAAILTTYGTWRFEGPVAVERAAEVLRGGFVSAVGHAGAADFLTRLLGVPVPVNRTSVEMQRGDRAVVLRLKARLPEGAVLSDEQMRTLPFELGLLSRLQ